MLAQDIEYLYKNLLMVRELLNLYHNIIELSGCLFPHPCKKDILDQFLNVSRGSCAQDSV